MNGLSALLAGALFGAGLAVSGMADPANVLGFLVLAPGWNPALIGVMGGALVVTAIGYRFVIGRERPLLAESFSLPEKTEIDGRIIAGAILFGVGWGLTGYCPGPGLVGLAVLDTRALAFVLAFLAGVVVYELMDRRVTAAPAATGDG